MMSIGHPNQIDDCMWAGDARNSVENRSASASHYLRTQLIPMLHSAAVGVGVATGAVCLGRFVPVFFATTFLTGALFAAFAGAGLSAAFFTAAFFRGGAALLAAALAFAALAALALLRFATSFAFAAAESLRLGFGSSGVTGSDWLFNAAHRCRWASAIRFRPAADILRSGFLQFRSSGRFWPVAVQHRPKFGNLSVDPELLSFESFNSSVDDFVREFLRRHIRWSPDQATYILAQSSEETGRVSDIVAEWGTEDWLRNAIVAPEMS